MKDTFADSPRSLRLDMQPMPETPFVLRFDYQANAQGQQGGLPFQSTEWETVNAANWEQAREVARNRVAFLPSSLFERCQPHHLQGVVLVDNSRRDCVRTVAFRKVAA